MGMHPRLSSYSDMDFDDDEDLQDEGPLAGCYTDPLVIIPLEAPDPLGQSERLLLDAQQRGTSVFKERASYLVADPLSSLPSQAQMRQEAQREAQRIAALSLPYAYKLDVSLDSINKAGDSGCGSVWIALPEPGADGLLQGTPDVEGLTLIAYLRLSFQWGGFPGLRHYPEAAKRARRQLKILTEGLLPI
jgi:hypothetical protein